MSFGLLVGCYFVERDASRLLDGSHRLVMVRRLRRSEMGEDSRREHELAGSCLA